MGTNAPGGNGINGNILINILNGDIQLNTITDTVQGFLLSGSLTTDDGIGDNILILGTNLLDTSYPATPAGTYENIPVSTGTGNGSGALVNIVVTGLGVNKVGVVNGGSGYAIGDQLFISEPTLQSFGMTVSAGTLNLKTLTAADLDGGGTPYMLNFNPSPVSSSFGVVPDSQKLLIGGPQLALYHAYNTTVSQSLFNTNLPQTSNNTLGAGTLLWTTSGSDPANSNNYMTWAPDGSDAQSYQDTNIPFKIERGDVIRVEGIKNISDAATNSSSSINIEEDFIVENVIPYYYSSSFNDNSQDRDSLDDIILPTQTSKYSLPVGANLTLAGANSNVFTGTIGGALTTNGNPGRISTVTVVGGTGTGYTDPEYPITSVTPAGGTGGTIQITGLSAPGVPSAINIKPGDFGTGYNPGDVISYGGSGASGATATVVDILDTGVRLFRDGFLVTNIGQSGGTIGSGATVQIVLDVSNAAAPGFVNIQLSGGYGFKYGDQITVQPADIMNIQQYSAPGNGVPAATLSSQLSITLNNDSLGNEFFNNDFTVGVNVNADVEGIPPATVPSGSQVGYHLYEKGEVAFTADTFIQVTPDPNVTLNGLLLGEVKKFTVRRQIEADDKVMLKNIPPPSGSKGIETPSGQGFLIPNDFSEVQKSNALNIINQLKAKNAFNKPVEPGITDGGNSIIVQGSGSDTIINIP
jgi:hypothetical protein